MRTTTGYLTMPKKNNPILPTKTKSSTNNVSEQTELFYIINENGMLNKKKQTLKNVV